VSRDTIAPRFIFWDSSVDDRASGNE
jgi:hypothetical protein